MDIKKGDILLVSTDSTSVSDMLYVIALSDCVSESVHASVVKLGKSLKETKYNIETKINNQDWCIYIGTEMRIFKDKVISVIGSVDNTVMTVINDRLTEIYVINTKTKIEWTFYNTNFKL